MRAFLMLYLTDFVSDDDDDGRPKHGQAGTSEKRTFTLLSIVCWCWWRTLVGFPESPTAHWVKHRLKKLIKRECA